MATVKSITQATLIKESKVSIYTLLLVLIFFIPSASTVGGFQLWYVLIVGLIYVSHTSIKIIKDNISRGIFFFVMASASLLVLSVIFSIGNYGSLKDTNEILRIAATLGLFSLIYSIYHSKLNDKTVLFFKLFIWIQLLVCYLQSFDIANGVLGFIWNTDRVWAHRKTGTFANPNILSIFSISAYCFVYFYSTFRTRLIYGFLVLLIILFSSSKTGLISFILIISLNYVLTKNSINLKTIILFSIGAFLLLYIVIQFLFLYRDSYPYMAQLLELFENDMDVGSIKSIGDRQLIWENALSHYHRLPLMQKIVGIGPAKNTDLNVIDNEFLTILIKMGWLGSILYVQSLLLLIVYLLKYRWRKGAKIMLSIIVLFLLASGSASTFTAWHLSLLFFFLLAACLKDIKNKNAVLKEQIMS